ncbi:protein translocase subunit SecB [Acetobacter indonesiensis NRIC 0313]|uniref:Protein translocase subunit SecB n=1 Tax=Acetobacter indonesiensis TaxID=104101 RepID=A0A6N3T8R6_9PROT|nr:protein-export chaperone SecB [Acetobacter indonesiensis]GAN64417.1 protein translocase subunit SecB [Acetobacter indonesiensis]GBQ60902.1 protein translocase subunit SecB [Acetobacter indonesiensis NRIC 0313]GEN04570.1 protein-export protein SecB [Acetobacter indonesiensis]
MSGHNERIIDSVGGGSQAASGAPGLLMGIQYSKNVTFQVLNAPAVYTRVQDRPHVAIAVDVSAHQLGENQPTFEVELILRCQGQTNSTNGEKPVALFEANLVYAGIFTLQNSTSETFEPLLLVEAPRLLFPGARHMLATLSREAGFLPVLVQQIDFADLWRSRRSQA